MLRACARERELPKRGDVCEDHECVCDLVVAGSGLGLGGAGAFHVVFATHPDGAGADHAGDGADAAVRGFCGGVEGAGECSHRGGGAVSHYAAAGVGDCEGHGVAGAARGGVDFGGELSGGDGVECDHASCGRECAAVGADDDVFDAGGGGDDAAADVVAGGGLCAGAGGGDAFGHDDGGGAAGGGGAGAEPGHAEGGGAIGGGDAGDECAVHCADRGGDRGGQEGGNCGVGGEFAAIRVFAARRGVWAGVVGGAGAGTDGAGGADDFDRGGDAEFGAGSEAGDDAFQ